MASLLGRNGRPYCGRLMVIGVVALALFIYAMWFGMNSDRDNVPPLLTQLIPAGHCTCQTATTFQCDSCLDCAAAAADTEVEGLPSSSPIWTFQYGRDDRNAGLDHAQCDASFPGLYEDIDRAGRYWNESDGISTSRLDGAPLEHGMVRAIIADGELYVVAARAKGEDHRRKIVAVLSSIYRALSASPTRRELRDIEFVFSIEDLVGDVGARGYPIWALSRKASEESVWLMPDFGWWAWDNASNDIGPYSQVVDSVTESEDGEPSWGEKQKKLDWRGKLSFAPKLRRALLNVARGKAWGDVKELDWSRKDNFLSMEDHCKYMFIAHVEGRSYSASLKYRQACRSVIVAHKLQYIQHHHYLLLSSGPHQNYVEVERDFSDLPATMDVLIGRPELAKQIADNSVKTFRERYLTQAAEACYWRALFTGWAAASPKPELWKKEGGKKTRRGVRYESFLLMDAKDMLSFDR